MDFSIDLLYLCLFFPLWTCLLIVCCSSFLSFDTKKVTTAFSFLSALFPLLFAISAGAQHISYENSFQFISINEINIQMGAFANTTNILLIALFSVCSIAAIILNYKQYNNDKNYNKYLLLINLLNIFALGFFLSPNLIQMLAFYISFSTIFYCLENLKNDSHERAKNFLVINRIGDFTLFAVIGALFYFNVFYGFQNGASVLEINDLDLLFSGLQSVCDTQFILLLSLLLIMAVLIKSILVFIHPLKSKSDVFLLLAISITSGIYWLLLFLPAFEIFEYFNIVLCTFISVFIISAIITVCLKLLKHDVLSNINYIGTSFVKKIYLKFAKGIEFFDKIFLDKLYENISKFAMKISGYFQFSGTKTTLYALIFNILGIGFLILAAFIIYNMTMKG